MKKIITVVALCLLLTCPVLLFSCSCNKESKISSYIIDITYDNGVVSGKEKVTFFNNTDNAFKELKFNLHANAFRKGAEISPILSQYKTQSYYNGESYGGYEILGASHAGQQLEFSICGIDQNILAVTLLEEVFPDESVTVTIDYKITLANVIARTGVNQQTVNLANFYPVLCGIEDGGFYECVYYAIGDPYYADCADYTVNVTLDQEYTVASSGKIIQSATSGNKSTLSYEGKNIRNFALVLSKNYNVLSDNSLGYTVNYYYYKDSAPEQSLKITLESLKYFTETFGKYPYDSYSVCETKFIQGGMEFSGLVMISDVLAQPSYGEVIVHETAHQWWEGGVGNNEIKYGFLDESLAEYSVVLFYESHKDYGFQKDIMIANTKKTYTQFCSIYDKLFSRVDTSMLRPLNEYSSEYEYVNIAYVKGCLMLDDIREIMGDDEFFKHLKSYYKQNVYKNATPDDLVFAFQSYNQGVDGFFDGYFNGKVVIGLNEKNLA